jgi:hypothetical protein|mmetsp:Transcript_1822/g.3246  ORF Transcript_1822/g.3246 Transcript_1822/m.3246 type:complete len:223 (-) Transcript_1822:1155-1823(-)
MVSFQKLCLLSLCSLIANARVSHGFVPSASQKRASGASQLNMGLFDNWSAGGSGNSKESLDAEWEAQQEILRNRRKPKAERDQYFKNVERRRQEASKKQQDMWAWQTKSYKKGEDPIDEWKKRRESGVISDLENQYGDPKEIGGIPIPGASFGVGGEFGVGGKFDNGGRFDLRLPYADQGYVDEDADVMSRLGSIFGGKKKKVEEMPKKKVAEKKANKWPWE